MLVVGIAGGTGSGKTTLARSLIDRLGNKNSVLIPHDSYYKDLSHLLLEDRKKLNFDHPDAFETGLLIEDIKKLKNNQEILMPTYDYSTYTRKLKTITVKAVPVIIVEGILVLTDHELRSLFDIKVYVDTDPDIRILRRLMRDISERERTVESVNKQYLSTVKPMHDAFVEPSKRYADIIVPEGGHNSVAIDIIFNQLNNYLEKNGCSS